MKLHLDQNAFVVLINNIHEKSGYRLDVLEKDYYVVLILEELAKYQSRGLQAYFKGGTALYKALKTTNRFSEDIDLSVDARGCSRTQNDKRLELATKRYTVLKRNIDECRTNRSEVIAVYNYKPLLDFDANDALQRFGKVKIEATSFTISEPVEELLISPIIYELATDEQKKILEKQYKVSPFKIKVITLKRIFVDKLFAAESYYRKSNEYHRAFDVAKHIYDLAILLPQPKIVDLLNDEKELKHLLDIRMKEEQIRLDGIPNLKPKDFIFFESIKENKRIKDTYEIMQNQYVLLDKDKISFDEVCLSMSYLKTKLLTNSSWINS